MMYDFMKLFKFAIRCNPIYAAKDFFQGHFLCQVSKTYIYIKKCIKNVAIYMLYMYIFIIKQT